MFSALLILCVSVPTMNATISAPIKLIARQMVDLAAGDTEIDVHETDRTDEIGDISRALAVLRDAVRANNMLTAEIKARDDREERLRREAAIREKVEHYSVDLSAATAKLGDMTRRMARLLRGDDRPGAPVARRFRSRPHRLAASGERRRRRRHRLRAALGGDRRNQPPGGGVDRRGASGGRPRPTAPAPKCCGFPPPPIASATW